MKVKFTRTCTITYEMDTYKDLDIEDGEDMSKEDLLSEAKVEGNIGFAEALESQNVTVVTSSLEVEEVE